MKLIVKHIQPKLSYLIEDGYILTLKDSGFVSKSCTVNKGFKIVTWYNGSLVYKSYEILVPQSFPT